jgi:hypothetical protein
MRTTVFFHYVEVYVMKSQQSKSKDVSLRHAGEKGERRYISYSLLTSMLDGSGQRHTPAALYPR